MDDGSGELNQHDDSAREVDGQRSGGRGDDGTLHADDGGHERSNEGERSAGNGGGGAPHENPATPAPSGSSPQASTQQASDAAADSDPAPTTSPAPASAGMQPPFPANARPAPTDTQRLASPGSHASGAIRPRRKPVFEAHTLSHFISSTRIPRHLEALVARSLSQGTALEHVLIHGAPGSGTALLARALLADCAPRRIVEIDAALGIDAEQLRRSVEEAGPRGVLSIKHLDALSFECEQALVDAMFHRGARPRRRMRPQQTEPMESDLDRAIAESAAIGFDPSESAGPARTPMRGPGPSLVATAHAVSNVGYLLRTHFDHMFHLRGDPKGLRAAIVRSLRRSAGIELDVAAIPRLERVLHTLGDAAEPILHAIALRAEAETIDRIDGPLMDSILEEDLAQRLPDEAYACSLRIHLGGRKLKRVTSEEVARIAAETGWGTIAAEGAISMLIRENQNRRQR